MYARLQHVDDDDDDDGNGSAVCEWSVCVDTAHMLSLIGLTSFQFYFSFTLFSLTLSSSHSARGASRSISICVWCIYTQRKAYRNRHAEENERASLAAAEAVVNVPQALMEERKRVSWLSWWCCVYRDCCACTFLCAERKSTVTP